MFYDYIEEKTDEPHAIPRGSGTLEGYFQMEQKIKGFTYEDLNTIRDALDKTGFSSCNYWNRAEKIGMLEWAEAIMSEIDNRRTDMIEAGVILRD